ncbi:MAG: glycosyltransferase family A protein [Gammaproteobacteria bacterium]
MQVYIIVPFFQHKRGILARAIRSVCAQRQIFDHPDVERIELIVVDDASPVRAESELNDVQFPVHLKYRIIHQDNQGPAGARNRGLDVADKDGFIAFLDSDDEWGPDHLARAVTSLQSGYDVYACNWIPLNATKDVMRMPSRRSLTLTPSAILGDAGEIVGDPLISEMNAPMCKLSGLAYRMSRFSSLRFDARLRNASEDRLFVYMMMMSRPKVMISKIIEVYSGRGINVYESVPWGGVSSLAIVYDQTSATLKARDQLTHHEKAKTMLRRQLCTQRRDFAAIFWHMLVRFRLPLRQLARQMMLDPFVMCELLRYPLRRLDHLGKSRRTEGH